MGESEVFDKLVKELDPIERKQLLEKLEFSQTYEAEPMIRKASEEEMDLEKEFYSLGFLARIIIFFRVTFRGEDKFQITEDIILKRIERELKRTSGDILSYKNGRLKESFLAEIRTLHESVNFFAPEVESASGLRRDEFLNFLGSLQIPGIHHQLIIDTNFRKTEEKTRLTEPADVRKEVVMNVENDLNQVTGELRRAMYMNSQTVFIMGEIVKFDFTGLEELFTAGDDKQKSCYFGDARIRLERLTELLSSFRISPDRQLMEAFFLFNNDSIKVNDEAELQTGLQVFLESARKHLLIIRKFNSTMQLPKVMKLITGNVDYKPDKVSGGEDWFNIYKAYWENLVERKYRKYRVEKHKQKIYQDMQMYFKKDKLPELEFYRYSYKYSCGFLNLFLREQFTTSLNEVLKKILVDGKFYKKSNKNEFTDSYSSLLSMYEKLRNFDDKNSVKGEYGMKLDAVANEASSESIREKKKAAIIEASDFEAFEIIKKGLESLLSLKNVLYGILYGKAGGQYDSLTNLNKLITVESRDFIIDLNEVYNKIDDAYRILGDILSLEEV